MAPIPFRGESAHVIAGETVKLTILIGELEAVEAAAGRGIFQIMQRMAAFEHTVAETRLVLAHGLKRAGVKNADDEARRLINEDPKAANAAAAAALYAAFASSKKVTGVDLDAPPVTVN